MAKPIGAQIKVKLVVIPKTSLGGIILTDNTNRYSEVNCNVGEIVEIGPCAFKGTAENPSDEPLYKLGDMVYFIKHAGFGIAKKNKGAPERIIDFRDVKAIVEDDDELFGFN